MSLCVLAAAIVPSACYLLGYQGVAHHPHTPGIKDTLRTFMECLAMSFSPVDPQEGFWPLEAFFHGYLLLFSAAWLLIRVWGQRPDQRSRALGLFLFLLAILGLAARHRLGTGRARSRFGLDQSLCDAHVSRIVLRLPGSLCSMDPGAGRVGLKRDLWR